MTKQIKEDMVSGDITNPSSGETTGSIAQTPIKLTPLQRRKKKRKESEK